MKQIILLKSQLCKIGGIEKNVWKIAKRFVERKYLVKILTSSEKAISNSCFEILTCKEKKYLPSFYKIFRFNRFCKRQTNLSKNQIIFGMDRTENQTHIRAGNGVHKAYLSRRAKKERFLKRLSFLLNPLHRIILSYEKKAFESKALKALFVNSNLVKKEVLQFYNVDPKKIHVIHNGVEWNEYEEAFNQSFDKRSDLLKTYNLPSDGTFFLFIGNGYERKGLLELLHAFSMLNMKNIYLLVVGKDKNISYYQKKSRKLNIHQKVYFFGCANTVIPFYQIADVFILPTHYDPFSNVVIEALAMGLFVITSLDNGAHEILTQENGQVLHDPYNIEEIYQSLANALNIKKTRASAIRIRNGVKQYDYSWQLDQLIDKVISS